MESTPDRRISIGWRPAPAAWGRVLIALGLVIIALGLTPRHAWSGFLGHNTLGDFGLQSGTQADPGTYLSLMYYRYDSDTLRDRDGNAFRLDPAKRGDIAVNALALGVVHVTNFKILGGNYGFMVFPAITDNKLESPVLGLDQSTAWGLADLYVQPINLGWKTKRADFTTALGVYAPTGSYDPAADDNLGLGMWSFEFSAGTTVYLDRKKTWHFAATAFYETHTEKKDTDIRVGDILTLEGGLGKSFMGGLLNAGIAYYAQWKTTDDKLGQDLEQTLQTLGLPPPGKHSGYAFGPEVTVPIASKRKLFGFLTARYFWETGVQSSLEGNAFVLTFTAPIPSTPLQ